MGFHTHRKEFTADVRGPSFVIEHDPADKREPYKAYKSGAGKTFSGKDASTVIQLTMDALA